ncbi:MAG TPA: porin family protein [Spirochaetota bacterium]|nr:porin family protein [Spirochaetota bacterium]HPI90595.1 porin family protein [Spirochaetota bacterium]HPR50103.1 porin family protein [Spirochaetota bacterium]
MRTLIPTLVLSLSLFCVPLFAADEQKGDPNVSFGIGITGGISSVWQRVGDTKWNLGYCYGAGFIVEKMFSNRLGIHSGLWYLQSAVTMEMPDNEADSDAAMHLLTVPLYLIVAANRGIFSFNFLTGMDLTALVACTTHTDTDLVNNKTADVKKYLTPYQFGLAMGMNFKFRVAKFIDLYIGVIGDFYLSSLDKDHGGSDYYSHMYDARATMGVLFRTNIFPMPDKK